MGLPWGENCVIRRMTISLSQWPILRLQLCKIFDLFKIAFVAFCAKTQLLILRSKVFSSIFMIFRSLYFMMVAKNRHLRVSTWINWNSYPHGGERLNFLISILQKDLEEQKKVIEELRKELLEARMLNLRLIEEFEKRDQVSFVLFVGGFMILIAWIWLKKLPLFTNQHFLCRFQWSWLVDLESSAKK